MKKIAAIVIVLLIVVGIVIFVLIPKEFRLELTSGDLQKKASEKFPQIIGKAMKLEMPELPDPSKLPGVSKLPKLPGASKLPKLPGASKLPKLPGASKLPKLSESLLPQYLLMGMTLHPPTFTLSEGKLHIAFDQIDIRVTGAYLFEFRNASQLPGDSEYIPVVESVRTHFSDEYALTEQAAIKHSGKDTWLIQDGAAEYMLAQEEQNIRVFATKQEGSEVRGVSSHAQAKLSGELEYERAAHTVFFQGIEVYEFTIAEIAQPGAAPAGIVQELVKKQVNTVLQEEQRIPVMDLKDTAEKQQPKMIRVLSKLFLKDIVILKDKLTIILALKK